MATRTKKTRKKNWILVRNNVNNSYHFIPTVKLNYKPGHWHWPKPTEMVAKTEEELKEECKGFTIVNADEQPLPFILKLSNGNTKYVVDMTTGLLYQIRTRDLISYFSNNIVTYGVIEGLFTFVKQGRKLCLNKIKDLE